MLRKMNVFLCLVLVSAVLMSACGNQEVKKTDATAKSGTVVNSIVTEPGTFPVVKDKYTMKIFAGQVATIEDLATNEFTKMYEQKTNVHIVWEVAPQNALNDKRKITLASGDFPDIFMAAGVTKDEEILYGASKMFTPLNNLIDKQTVWLKAAFKDLPTGRAAITTPDGNIYSLPSLSDVYHITFANKIWLNSKWLKKLNLNTPKTTEDFYNVLKAFKEKDPNGNGKKDEIPLMTTANKDSKFINVLMNSFIQNDHNSMFINKEGKIDVAYNKPEWKKGLQYLKKLVAEGLIDQTTFGATNEQVKKIAENSDAELLGCFIQLAPLTFFNLTGEKHKSFDSISPLKGPDGAQFSIWNPYAAIGSGNLVVTSKLKNPEVAVRWADWFYSFEGALESRIGREGKEWRRAQQNEKSYTGQPATWGKLTAIGGAQNFFWAQWGVPTYGQHTKQLGNPDIYSSDGAAIETRLYQASKDNYDPYKPQKTIPPLYIESEDMKKIAQPLNDINTYVDEYIVRFATGDLDIDKEWDNYVKKMDSMGVKDILAAYQKAYDAFVKNSK